MSSKYCYKNGKSKIAALILAAVSFFMLIGVLILFFSANFYAAWLTAVIVPLFVASFVLTLCAAFVDPKLITAATVVNMFSQFVLLFVVLSQASDCVLFDNLPKWVQIVVPAALAVLFAGFYVGFVVSVAKSAKRGAPARSVKPFFALAIVAFALVLGFDTYTAVSGQKRIVSQETYRGGDYTAYSILQTYGHSDGYWTVDWEDDNNDTTLIVYNFLDSVSIDYNEEYSDEDYFYAAFSQMTQSVSVNFEDCFRLRYGEFSTEIFKNFETYPQYILQSTNYTYDTNVILLSFEGCYKDGFYTARRLFESIKGVNLARTDSYKVVPDSYSYFGFAAAPAVSSLKASELTIAEVQNVYRVPNVFFVASAVCGLAALYLLTVRCEVVERQVKKVLYSVGASTPAQTAKSLTAQNIGLNVFLTVVTLGIYGFVWFYQVAKSVRVLNGKNFSGLGDEVALYVVGGRFYGEYWYYTNSKLLAESAEKTASKSGVLSSTVYLLASIFSLGILPLCLISNDINKLICALAGDEKPEATPSKENLSLMDTPLGLVKTILLSAVTLGVYYVIAKARVVNRFNILKGNRPASASRLVCLFLVPFYWIYWLATYLNKLDEEGNRATLECWLVNLIPFYGVYWLLSRGKDIAETASQYSVSYQNNAVFSLLCLLIPALGYGVTLSALDKISANINMEQSGNAVSE